MPLNKLKQLSAENPTPHTTHIQVIQKKELHNFFFHIQLSTWIMIPTNAVTISLKFKENCQTCILYDCRAVKLVSSTGSSCIKKLILTHSQTNTLNTLTHSRCIHVLDALLDVFMCKISNTKTKQYFQGIEMRQCWKVFPPPLQTPQGFDRIG